MKVTMTADLGAWVQPQSGLSGVKGHQGPRKRAGPSYLRRQKRCAADRAAASPSSTTPATPASADGQAAASPKPAHTCKKCGQPCHGHNGPTGERCRQATHQALPWKAERLLFLPHLSPHIGNLFSSKPSSSGIPNNILALPPWVS